MLIIGWVIYYNSIYHVGNFSVCLKLYKKLRVKIGKNWTSYTHPFSFLAVAVGNCRKHRESQSSSLAQDPNCTTTPRVESRSATCARDMQKLQQQQNPVLSLLQKVGWGLVGRSWGQEEMGWGSRKYISCSDQTHQTHPGCCYSFSGAHLSCKEGKLASFCTRLFPF